MSGRGLLLLAVVSQLALLASRTEAMDCGYATLQTRFDAADNVFSAIVVDNFAVAEGTRTIAYTTVRAIESFKGTQPFSYLSTELGQTMSLEAPRNGLEVGAAYLFFAPDSGRIIRSACLQTETTQAAAGQLERLRAFKQGTARDLGEPWVFQYHQELRLCRLTTVVDHRVTYGSSGSGFLFNVSLSFSFDGRPDDQRDVPDDPRARLRIMAPNPVSTVPERSADGLRLVVGDLATVVPWEGYVDQEITDGRHRDLHNSYLLQGESVIEIMDRLVRTFGPVELYMSAAGSRPEFDVVVPTTGLRDSPARMMACVQNP